MANSAATTNSTVEQTGVATITPMFSWQAPGALLQELQVLGDEVATDAPIGAT